MVDKGTSAQGRSAPCFLVACSHFPPWDGLDTELPDLVTKGGSTKKAHPTLLQLHGCVASANKIIWKVLHITWRQHLGLFASMYVTNVKFKWLLSHRGQPN